MGALKKVYRNFNAPINNKGDNLWERQIIHIVYICT